MCAEITGEITGVCATGVSDQQGAEQGGGFDSSGEFLEETGQVCFCLFSKSATSEI